MSLFQLVNCPIILTTFTGPKTVRSWTRLSAISLQPTISCLLSSKQDSQMPEGESAYLRSVIVKIKKNPKIDIKEGWREGCGIQKISFLFVT
jgi:hypothetical protein